MANKYLEKIATITEKEINDHADMASLKGFAAGTLVPIIGSPFGRGQELGKVKSKISGKKEGWQIGKGITSSLRAFGRSGVEGFGGAVLGAGVGTLASRGNPLVARATASLGAAAGSAHGYIQSGRNSTRKYIGEWRSKYEK